MMNQKKPAAVAQLDRGTTIMFQDYQTGARLDDNFEGRCRILIGGVVDAVVDTRISNGVRWWGPPKDN